jgi:hypothetical protein
LGFRVLLQIRKCGNVSRRFRVETINIDLITEARCCVVFELTQTRKTADYGPTNGPSIWDYVAEKDVGKL